MRKHTPNILRVQIRDMDILDNNILSAIGNAQTNATNNTRTSYTNNTPFANVSILYFYRKEVNSLVARNINERSTRFVISDRDRWIPTRCAPVRAIDSILATIIWTGVTRRTTT